MLKLTAFFYFSRTPPQKKPKTNHDYFTFYKGVDILHFNSLYKNNPFLEQLALEKTNNQSGRII